ncbi:MAG: prepilin-type N-terminal cleavage/methylation domain-containing protein [Clostridia bacterium]
MKGKKKGFTLVELMIVIVIIGILAAIIVPTVTGAIQKGKIAKDQADVKTMNMFIAMYKAEIGATSIDIHDAYNAITSNNIIPKATSNDNTFWFDTVSEQVVLANTKNAIVGNVNLNKGKAIANNTFAATTPHKNDNEVEALSTNKDFLYFDFGNNPISNAIKGIRGYANHINTLFAEVIKGINEQAVKTHLEQFNPAENAIIFISETNNVLSKAAETARSATKIVFDLGVSVIPQANYVKDTPLAIIVTTSGTEDITLLPINLPNSVRVVRSGAFSKITGFNTINASGNIFFESGSLTDDLKHKNNIQENVAKGYNCQTTIATIKDGEKYAEILPTLTTGDAIPKDAASVIFRRILVRDCVVYYGELYDAKNRVVGLINKIGYFTSVKIDKSSVTSGTTTINGITVTLPEYVKNLTNINDYTKYTVTLEKDSASPITIKANSDFSFVVTGQTDLTGYTLKITYNTATNGATAENTPIYKETL